MTDGIEALTTAALSIALDAASLRQQTFASNIANANALDYVPQRVSFESQLEELRRGLAGSGRLDASALREVTPRVEQALDARGLPTQVQLDVEAAGMARNTVQYQALVTGLSRHFAILSMAASDGRK